MNTYISSKNKAISFKVIFLYKLKNHPRNLMAIAKEARPRNKLNMNFYTLIIMATGLKFSVVSKSVLVAIMHRNE
jgi:hypothetical protein